MKNYLVTEELLSLVESYVLISRSSEGLEFSRPGHLAVEIDSDFNPSVDCGAVI